MEPRVKPPVDPATGQPYRPDAHGPWEVWGGNPLRRAAVLGCSLGRAAEVER